MSFTTFDSMIRADGDEAQSNLDANFDSAALLDIANIHRIPTDHTNVIDDRAFFNDYQHLHHSENIINRGQMTSDHIQFSVDESEAMHSSAFPPAIQFMPSPSSSSSSSSSSLSLSSTASAAQTAQTASTILGVASAPIKRDKMHKCDVITRNLQFFEWHTSHLKDEHLDQARTCLKHARAFPVDCSFVETKDTSSFVSKTVVEQQQIQMVSDSRCKGLMRGVDGAAYLECPGSFHSSFRLKRHSSTMSCSKWRSGHLQPNNSSNTSTSVSSSVSISSTSTSTITSTGNGSKMHLSNNDGSGSSNSDLSSSQSSILESANSTETLNPSSSTSNAQGIYIDNSSNEMLNNKKQKKRTLFRCTLPFCHFQDKSRDGFTSHLCNEHNMMPPRKVAWGKSQFATKVIEGVHILEKVHNPFPPEEEIIQLCNRFVTESMQPLFEPLKEIINIEELHVLLLRTIINWWRTNALPSIAAHWNIQLRYPESNVIPTSSSSSSSSSLSSSSSSNNSSSTSSSCSVSTTLTSLLSSSFTSPSLLPTLPHSLLPSHAAPFQISLSSSMPSSSISSTLSSSLSSSSLPLASFSSSIPTISPLPLQTQSTFPSASTPSAPLSSRQQMPFVSSFQAGSRKRRKKDDPNQKEEAASIRTPPQPFEVIEIHFDQKPQSQSYSSSASSSSSSSF